MLRIVKTAEGEILPDITGRMNGRGAYICLSEECLEKAVKRHGLERAFKAPVPEDSVGKISEFIKNSDTSD